MQNRKMKKAVAIMMVAATIGIVSGCGKKEEKSEVTTTVTDTQESDVTVNEVAIDQVFNHIEVNGVHVDFPFTLNDLGDEYEFDNYVDMGDGRYIMDLIFNGENIASVSVFAKSKEEIDRNSNITDINITRSNKQVITINSIDCNSTVEDVEKNLDKLPFYYDENKLVTSIEYSDNGYSFYLHIDEGKTITGIYMDKKGE